MTNLFTFPLTDEEIEAASVAYCALDMILDHISFANHTVPNALPPDLFSAIEALQQRVNDHANLTVTVSRP